MVTISRIPQQVNNSLSALCWFFRRKPVRTDPFGPFALTALLRGTVFFPVLLRRVRAFIWDEKNIEAFLQAARLKVFNNKLVSSRAGQVGTISRIPKQVKDSLFALCWFSGGNLSVRTLSTLLHSQQFLRGAVFFSGAPAPGPGVHMGREKHKSFSAACQVKCFLITSWFSAGLDRLVLFPEYQSR